jgi:hypothetical protein
LKSDRAFTKVFGTAAEAGDATDVAPTNMPAQSAPITLFLRTDPFLRLDIAFPFRLTFLMMRLRAVMR